MRISVLGLGRMGQAIASRLLEGNHQVTVWNRSPNKAGALVERGAGEAPSLAEAAGASEVCMTMLADDGAVRQQALGQGGILDHLPPGGLYVDCSTVSPHLAGELAERFGPDRFVSMPVLGAPAAVAAGKATYLLGGSGPALARLQPALETLSSSSLAFAQPRLANAAKLTSNLLLLSGVVALAEALAVGRAGGLSDDELRALLAESPMLAQGFRNRFEGVVTGNQDPWWSASLGAKDAHLAVEVAAHAGVKVPVATLTADRYKELAGQTPEVDIAAVGSLYPKHA